MDSEDRQPQLPSETLTDDELLSGLWWGDPEFPAEVDAVWRGYVERKHRWNNYKRGVAGVLRQYLADAEAAENV